MRRRRGHTATDLTPNLTSLIDVTFLLIVFFVLVSKIVEIEHVGMNLPEPVDPMSAKPGGEHQAVVNVLPGPNGTAEGYAIRERFFAADAEGLEALTQHIAGLYADDPQVRINLRSDQGITYEFVHPAMKAVTVASSRAGMVEPPRINLVIEPTRRGPS